MSDKPESTKKTKLRLAKPKLSFNKSTLGKPLTRTVQSSTSKTIVEVKGKEKAQAQISGSISNQDLKNRLSLIQKANISNKEKNLESKEKKPQEEISDKKITSADDTQATKDIENKDSAPVAEPQKKIEKNLPETSNNSKPAKAETISKKIEEKDEVKTTKSKPALPQKKLKKSDLINMLDSDSEIIGKPRSIASLKRAQAKRRKASKGLPQKIYREIIITGPINVTDLADKISERSQDVIKELMKLGVIAKNDYVMDAETAEIIVGSLGHKAKIEYEVNIEDSLDIDTSAREEDIKTRSPVVTVMGHVDHGKTSLLDALRETDQTSGEAGGITQHIGAYSVKLPDGRSICFIDTPGHEAFSQMRVRGASFTDIVVLVVAANDGVKMQTIEAINHAKAAGVPIVVAINKIDLPEANIAKVKNELLAHNIVADDLGGDVMFVPISAKNKTNLDKLEEAILLQAELQNLQADFAAAGSGVVVETKMDPSKGTLVTLLVQKGTVKKGDIIIAGESFGRVRKMIDDKGAEIARAMPSDPVMVQGLGSPPASGAKFHIVESEKKARDVAEYRMRKKKSEKSASSRALQMQEMFSSTGKKDINIIIKADTHGSAEAIVHSLDKLPADEVRIKIVHSGVGAITESDLLLASTTSSVVLGFNVRAQSKNIQSIGADKLTIRYYSIIYQLIDDVKEMLSNLLAPKIRENYIGSAEIKQVFSITKVGKIAGSYVTSGVIKKGAGVRLLRDNIVIHEGRLKTLKRFKDDVEEVKEGYECGIAFEKYEDIKEKDQLEVFEIIEEKRKI